MSSSQFAIFCIILIALFPLHEFADGQGVGAGNAADRTCTPKPCPGIGDKDNTCYCCPLKKKKENTCYVTKELCTKHCSK